MNRPLSLSLSAEVEHWPLAHAFTISRGTKTTASVIVVTLSDRKLTGRVTGRITGRGECVPYARYGETLEGVQQDILAMSKEIETAQDIQILHETINHVMAPGAARNALDCALWDYKAKYFETPVSRLLNIEALKPHLSAYTISLDTADIMAQKAREASAYPLLKLKLGGKDDDIRMRAVRHAVGDKRLIVDANEAWQAEDINRYIYVASKVGIELIEQPLPEGHDHILKDIDRLVPICADESTLTQNNLRTLAQHYDAVNIKLDKTGGLSEAFEMVQAAQALNLKVMMGCMVGTSLGMAPAVLLAHYADWVDLDGPLLLAKDRDDALHYEGSVVHPPQPQLWG